MSPFLFGIIVGILLSLSAFQAWYIVTLKGRIQGIAGILRKVPKRATDKVME